MCLVRYLMNEKTIEAIKCALAAAPRNQYMVELHIQSIKYADELTDITAREFCEALGLKASYATEFSKMRNLTTRLKAAGLDTRKL